VIIDHDAVARGKEVAFVTVFAAILDRLMGDTVIIEAARVVAPVVVIITTVFRYDEDTRMGRTDQALIFLEAGHRAGSDMHLLPRRRLVKILGYAAAEPQSDSANKDNSQFHFRYSQTPTRSPHG